MKSFKTVWVIIRYQNSWIESWLWSDLSFISLSVRYFLLFTRTDWFGHRFCNTGHKQDSDEYARSHRHLAQHLTVPAQAPAATGSASAQWRWQWQLGDPLPWFEPPSLRSQRRRGWISSDSGKPTTRESPSRKSRGASQDPPCLKQNREYFISQNIDSVIF